MAASFALDPAHSALLVMDFQVSILERLPSGSEAVIEAAALALAAARQAGLRIIYVVVGFRPGCPEISPRNQGFGALRNSPKWQLSTEIPAALAPHPEDVVVTKRRVSAFWGTDLEVVLRANELDTVVLAGISTSGVVLSTVRHAADADYRLLVLRDACADSDAEVHACLMDKVFPRQATIGDAAGLAALLSPQAI